jgi:UBX domain-containing protein 1
MKIFCLGQAFYAGGSERSGQQIIGPPKGKDADKKVNKIFEAARKQGAIEAEEDEDGSSQRKKEKAFTGVGHTLGEILSFFFKLIDFNMYLGDGKTPSPSVGQSLPGTTAAAAAAAAASNRPEQVPLRFFSDGFTVGDGELRKFEDNKEFMDYIKRGEVPPELKSLTAGGRQVEVNDQICETKSIYHSILFQVRLEDHRGEEYKPVAPQFKPFGGAGYMLGSPAPTVTSTTTTMGQSAFKPSTASTSSTASASTDSNRLEQLAEQQLKSSSSSTTIRLRLPDSSTPLRIAIDLNRTLADIRKFLSENVPSLQSNQFEFIEPPSTKIKREDEAKTISDAKLTNATLAIRRSS